jgi:hypothetical protein
LGQAWLGLMNFSLNSLEKLSSCIKHHQVLASFFGIFLMNIIVFNIRRLTRRLMLVVYSPSSTSRLYMFVARSLDSAALIRLSVTISITPCTPGKAFPKTIAARILSKVSWKTARIIGRWTVNIILLEPDTRMSSVSLGQVSSDGSGAMTTSTGALLPRLPSGSCGVAISTPVVTLLALAEPSAGGELCQIGRYKTPVSLNNSLKKVWYLLQHA